MFPHSPASGRLLALARRAQETFITLHPSAGENRETDTGTATLVLSHRLSVWAPGLKGDTGSSGVSWGRSTPVGSVLSYRDVSGGRKHLRCFLVQCVQPADEKTGSDRGDDLPCSHGELLAELGDQGLLTIILWPSSHQVFLFPV